MTIQFSDSPLENKMEKALIKLREKGLFNNKAELTKAAIHKFLENLYKDKVIKP